MDFPTCKDPFGVGFDEDTFNRFDSTEGAMLNDEGSLPGGGGGGLGLVEIDCCGLFVVTSFAACGCDGGGNAEGLSLLVIIDGAIVKGLGGGGGCVGNDGDSLMNDSLDNCGCCAGLVSIVFSLAVIIDGDTDKVCWGACVLMFSALFSLSVIIDGVDGGCGFV